MKSLIFVAALVLSTGICQAQETENLKERFEKMDLNGDGFLSETEFLNGMTPKDVASLPAVSEVSEKENIPEEERKELARFFAGEVKEMLPYKVDEMMTWQDAYEQDGNVHYLYQVTSPDGLPAELFKRTVKSAAKISCAKMTPLLCDMAKEPLLSKGINLQAHFEGKEGTRFFTCTFTLQDCP